jgi:sulfite reductase (ferredoxin)
MADKHGDVSAVEKIKQASRGLRGSLASELAADTSHFEDEAAQLLKFHGIYQQDDRDARRQRSDAGREPDYAFMVRCKIPGGVLTAEQYLVLDELAGRYGNGTLRVTTRQDNQFHGVVKGELKATIRALNDALVTTLGACGDVQRNVMCCPAPLPGALRDEVLQVARRISDHLLPRTRAYHEIWLNGEQVGSGAPHLEPDPIYGDRYLPRKFKTAIAFPDDNCTDVYSNDLGFLAIPDGGRIAGFNVLVGGGLGMTHGKKVTYPRLGDPLGFALPEDVVPVGEAVLTVQRDYGDRHDRRHARLKYLLDDRGLDWFRGQVEQRLGRPLPLPAPVGVSDVHDHLGWHDQGGGRSFYGLFVENGRIVDTEDVRLRTAVRRIVQLFGAGVHFTPQQNVLLTGIPEGRRAALEAVLAHHGVPGAGAISTVRRWSMACPALPTCGLALAEAERALPGVIDELERELERLGLADLRLTVRMTGCPNGCARPYTADLAFVGRSADKYTIFVGGSVLGTRLATAYADLVPRHRLVARVRPLLERYRAERLPGEGLGDFCCRVGSDELRDDAIAEPAP